MANSRSRGPQDRILLVESDPVICDLIGRQALNAAGYQVQVAGEANAAIAKALQWAPDLIMIDLHLPGLSGKDLLVALASQGITTPLIVIAQRGMEADIIQTFRLGAADYLTMPIREAEVVNAVHRVLKQVHERRERERLAAQVQQTNQDLQARVRELTTIYALGKAMTSVTDQVALLDMILDGALRIAQADLGWFLLRDQPEKPFLVVAERNLPAALGIRLNDPWDDGISSLVAMSGEVLNIHGEPIRRFKISSLGLSALIEPIKVQGKVLGLLVIMRKQADPFGSSDQHLLNALADYAAISLANARQFRLMEERASVYQRMANASQIGEKVNNDILISVKKELISPVSAALTAFEKLCKDPLARWRPDQRQLLTGIQEQLLHLHQVSEAITPLPAGTNTTDRPRANLTELVAQSLRKVQPYIQPGGLSVHLESSTEAVWVNGNSAWIAQALDGLFSNAVRYGGAGSNIIVRLGKTAPSQNNLPSAHLMVRNTGWVMEQRQVENAFEDAAVRGGAVTGSLAGKRPGGDRLAAERAASQRFGGLGIRLGLIKEIITRQNGQVWIESQPGTGTDLHVSLPLVR